MGVLDDEALADLHERIRRDAAFDHLRVDGVRLVPGIGSEEPIAMVVGEAPGATENERGEPFCGASGNVLAQLMELAGLRARPYTPGKKVPKDQRETLEPNVWLTNTVKYRPPGNRTPWFTEAAASAEHLRAEWRAIGKPRLIVCVGSVAATAIGAHTPSRVIRGEIYPLKAGVWVAYQFHPAYGLRGGAGRRSSIERQWETMGDLLNNPYMREELGWDTRQYPTVS
jgi:uracil-DNA glycosylase